MKNNIFKLININLLLVLLFATICPIIYSIFRTTWILNDGSTSYAMVSYNSYIQAIIEVLTVFLIMPLFTYKEKEYNSKSYSILFSIFLITIIIFLILFSFSFLIVEDMQEMNPGAERNELLSYLFIISLSDSISIISVFLIAEIVLQKENLKAVVLTTISILIKFFFDVLLLSPIAITNFSINMVAISSLVSSILMIIILLCLFFERGKIHS